MRSVELIDRKRRGEPHSEEELRALVYGYLQGEVPDYQMAAWLMAVCCTGMSEHELASFTEILARSGVQLDLSEVGRPVADKHSTGGVGDKVSLVALPLVAACGVPVGKMSGRGLGFTGGTVDKLESIPGMQMELSAERFVRQLKEVGIVISGQSADLAPADGKLYALRDVTATVESIPLIASSVMSKKLAGGAHCIVLDVKAGRGAFMREPERAVMLARAMIGIGRRAGRKVSALVTDMRQPLGWAVGNALEVREAIAALRGEGPADLEAIATEVAAEMVALADEQPHPEALARVRSALHGGAGVEAFARLVRAQGGDPRVVEEPGLLHVAPLASPLRSARPGYVATCDALVVAEVANRLGAGRARKGDPIDHGVGVVVRVKLGQPVEVGQELATVYARSEQQLGPALARLTEAIVVADEPPPPAPLIHVVLRGEEGEPGG